MGGASTVSGWPLRRRLAVLLLVAALVPMLAVGVLADLALQGVVRAGAGSGAVALEARSRADFARSAAHAGTLAAQDLLAVQARAQALAASAQYLFAHPAQFPGTQQGNSPLIQAPTGAWISQAGAPVGVFVPAGTPTPPPFWTEVNLVSHLDPFMETLRQSAGSPALVRLWLIAADGMVRAAPDPGYGHAGSPVTPRTRLTSEPWYQDATSARGAVWTAAPFPDPAGGPDSIVSVSVPVRDPAGRLVAVVGADASVAAVAASVGQGLDASDVALLTPAGRWVGGGAASQAYFAQPGKVAAVQAAARTGGSVASGPDLVAAAPVSPPGWLLVAASPAAAVLGPAAGLASALGAEREIEVAAVLGALVVAALAVWVAAVAARRTTRPLEELAGRIRATEEDAGGEAPPPAAHGDEVALVAGEFDQMRSRLREAAARVEEAALQRARAERAAELARLEDRNALAREVHDNLAQGFVALQMLGDAAAADADAGDWTAVARRLRRIADVAREGLAQARASVRDLVPAPDLAEALRREAARLELPVTVRVEGDPGRLPGPVRSALAAIAREALGNVGRHSQAASAQVSLTCVNGTARLEIADDGVGIGAPAGGGGAADLRGFGLSTMEARAAAVGGRLHVASAPGGGTTVTVEVAIS